MRSPFRRPLVPVPKQFDDPVKKSCAHAERKWTLATGGMGAGAATAGAAAASGLVLPPLVPILLAGAAVCGLFKTSAQWGKEDPPRGDYGLPVRLPERRVNLRQLEEPEAFLRCLFRDSPSALSLLISTVEEAGVRLAATVEAVEKSLGAMGAAEQGDDDADTLGALRFYEARVHALLTCYVLRSVGSASRNAQEVMHVWFQDEVEMVSVSTLWDAVDSEQAGQLLAAGVDPALLEISLTDAMPESLGELPQILGEAGESALALAVSLEAWASRDDEGSDPARLDEMPLVPSEGPSSAATIDLVHELFGPTRRRSNPTEAFAEKRRPEPA
jgi:hypothetical protein